MRGALAALASSVFLWGCGTSEPIGPDLSCMGAPSYARDILPKIVVTRCLPCHSRDVAAGDRQGAPLDLNFDTYESTMPVLFEFSDSITAGREPPRDLTPPLETSAEEREMVSFWRRCEYPP